MALPLRYSFRNVLIRWRSTFATVLGIALVVFVFVLLQSLAAGIERSSGNTGDSRNIMIVRKGSTAESASGSSIRWRPGPSKKYAKNAEESNRCVTSIPPRRVP